MDFDKSDKLDVSISARLLKEIVSPPVQIAASGLTNFRWSEDGLQIKTVDGSNAIVVEQEVLSTAFENYSVSPENHEIVFGTPCETISKLLKAARASDIISLNLNVETNRMQIEFADVNYSLAGVSPNSVNEPAVPELEYDIDTVVHSEVFQRAYQVVGMISEAIRFDIDSNQFRVTGRGDTDKAKIDVEIEPNKEAIQNRTRKCAATITRLSKPAEARFGTQFIQYVNEFTPETCLNASFREDYPLRIEADRADGKISTEIIIAPRMDSNT